MSRTAPDTLVFDVGLVLIGADYEPFLAYMRAHGADASDMEDFCRAVDLDAHERGEIRGPQFLDRIASRGARQPATGELHRAWNSMYYPDERMLDLARQATRNYRVFLLSNMGDLHWAHLEAAFAIPSLGHGSIASYTVGALKPDPAIYAAAEERFGLEPGRTVFIDDRPANIAAARVRGWSGIVHRDAADTARELELLGVRVPP